MNLLDRSLGASIFSVGKDAWSAAEARLPADALVIVIQDRSDMTAPPPLPLWPNYHRSEYKLLPGTPHQAGKAYSRQSRSRVPVVNVAA
jgi:hypothetical protein